MKRIVFLVVVGVILLMFTSGAAADVERGDSGQDVVEVQYTLRAYGYVLPVDGQFGPRTEKAVKHFQRVNGLLPDGIVGPVTATALAKRITPPTSQGSTQPVDPPSFPNLCEEMRWYMTNAGLPADPFMYLGMRESGCQNDAKPTIPKASCCRGWWAIHKSNITAPGYAPGARACGITTEWDYYGTSHEQKVKSACFAKVLWDWYVTHPGSTYPWRL